MTSVTLTEHLPDADVREVLALVEAATDADGVSPLSEHVSLHLRHGGDPHSRNLLAHDGGRLVGYAHLDTTDEVAGSSAEVVVHPAHRRAGVGGALVDELKAASPDGRLRLWAHGGSDAAERLAGSRGLTAVRELLQLRRSLLAPLPAAVLPDGVAVRTFAPGEDDDRWLDLNATAFAEHPEQGAWTRGDLRRRLQEPWFDPAGFFLAESAPDTDAAAEATGAPTSAGDAVAPSPPRLVGFHWTKVHGTGGGHGHEPIGEVYVVGVDPSARGTGLGKALTLVGLRHLRALGLPQAMLYVDAGNTGARLMYERLGFTLWDSDVMFGQAAEDGSPQRDGVPLGTDAAPQVERMAP